MPRVRPYKIQKRQKKKKSISFQYISNENLKFQIKNTMLFTLVPKYIEVEYKKKIQVIHREIYIWKTNMEIYIWKTDEINMKI